METIPNSTAKMAFTCFCVSPKFINIKKHYIMKLTLFYISVLFLVLTTNGFSAAISSTVSGGNWNTAGTWVGGVIPGAGDDVTIVDGATVNVDVTTSCLSLTISADGSASAFAGLIVNSGVTFTVIGNVDLSSSGGSNCIPSLETSTSATSVLIVQGDINFNNFDDTEIPTLTIKNASTLQIAGNFNLNTLNATVDFGIVSSLVEYNGSGAQTIIAPTANGYGKLKSSGTGARILDPTTTINIKNNSATCFDPGTNSYTITGSTIAFSGSGSQTIPVFNYNNLTTSGSRGANSITLTAGTIGIAGTFNNSATFTTGGYIPTGNTINFNGTGNQTIPMPATALYDNITFNCTGGIGATLAAAVSATNVAGNITVETGKLDNGGFAIAGNGAATFQVNNGTTFTLSGSSSFPTGFGTTTLQATSTVDYNGAGAQTIAALTYGNLTSSNSGGRTLAAGTINITGTYTTSNTSSYTVAGNTVNFNGGSAQTIPMNSAQSYNNITINNTSGANLGAAVTATNVVGNITVEAGTLGNGGFAMTGTGANTFQVNDGTTFQLTGSSAFPTGFGTVTLQPTALVDYNGSGSQTIAARSYTNLMSSNTGARTLGSGTIDISGTYTISNVSSSYTVAGNTVNFNGTSAQTIPMSSAAITLYNSITTNNTAGATLGALVNATNVVGNITVVTGFMDNGGFAITGNGSATLQVNDGATLKLTGTSTFPSGFGTTTLQTTSSTVDYAGTTQTVSGTPTYQHLTISGSGTKTLGAALDVNGTLTISAGTLDAGGFLMTLAGDFTNNATFTHSNNTVEFNGSGTQTVGGSATKTTFYNMKASTSAHTVNMANNADLINKIDIIDGATFDADGTGNDKTFTLVSTSTKNGNTFTGGGTAQVGDLSAGTFLGNVTYQRYMDGFTEWRSLGCPIQSEAISDWDATIYTSGFTGSDDPASGFISVYTFNAGSQTYTAAANTTDPISADNGTVDGKGFLAYIGNTSPGTVTTPVTLINTGTIVSGTKTPAVSLSYNLLANPYPAPLSFTNFYATNSGSLNNDFYYVYDYYTGGFDTWDESMGTSTNGRTSGTIANGQGFYVDVSTAGTLTFNETHKATTPDGNFLKLAASVYKKMRLTISSVSATPYTGSMLVAFSPVTADGYDIKEDALAMNPFAWNAPTLTSLSTDGKNLVINKMADLTKGYSIPVKAKVGVTGTYKITAPDLSEIGGCITLEDKLTGITTDLLSTNSYTFSISDTTQAPRFVLHISNPVAASFSANDTTVDVGVPVVFTNASTGATSYLWDFGDSNTDNVQSPTHTYTAAGDYTVKLTASNGSCSSNTTTIIVHVTSPLGINNSAANNNDIALITNGNGTFVKLDHVTAGVIEVFDLLGKNIHSQSFSGNHKLEQINMSAIGNGIYLVKVSTSETTLIKRIFIGN
ncbi:MAG: PKD domain-containing protein [Bacteroidetes bacterium]|nr:PKD domain-containing protein [Bacteroidota bacterium]